MYLKIFKRRRPGGLWRHALSLGLALALVSVGLRYNAQAAAGDLDATFGSGGKVTTDFSNSFDIAHAIARQSDGKLVVAGVGWGNEVDLGDFGLARYNHDGSLDSTFGVGGKVRTDFSDTSNQNVIDSVNAIAIRPDGKILAAGSTCPNREGDPRVFCDFALARYETNGSLDATFGNGGKVKTSLNLFTFDGSFAKAIAIQPDGKIIAAGAALDPAGDDAEVFALVRYDRDGSVDLSFGRRGQSITLINSCECGAVNAIALQPDGKIIAAGGYYFGLARYTSNGNLDATFGNGGIVTTDGENDYATAAVLQPDGKIVAAGFTSNYPRVDFALARFNSDGSPDSSFGIGAKVTTDFGGADSVLALALQPDGKLVASGLTNTAQDDFALARYNSDGSLDPTFGSGGKLTTNFGGNGASGNAVVLQQDGRIVVAGQISTAQDFDFALARYLTDVSPPTVNPIDESQFFVRQHYSDFLNRPADALGLAFWTNEITSCGADVQCVDAKRVNVSAAFFLSIEFQQTGYLVHRLYKAAYGDLPGTPVPVRFSEFLPDTQQIGQGVVVGAPGWEAQLENNKNMFASEFVARSRFTTAFPQGMTAEQFVDALNANAGGALSQAERDQLVSELASGAKTRAQVLRSVAENSNLAQQEFNRAFVLMQYFGYLRRNPSDAPDTNFAGYDFWLNKLNQFNGNFVQAEMVRAFLISIEYRQRFGQP
jgi:uncharacterized delta-60 repeat protein